MGQAPLAQTLGEDLFRGTDQPGAPSVPSKVPPLGYPGHFEVRYVSFNGGIRWKHDWVKVRIVCAGGYVRLEEIDNGVWNVYFSPIKLGRLLDANSRIEDANGRIKAQKPKIPRRICAPREATRTLRRRVKIT